MTYTFLQHYWWFIVSLLGALLVFLLFVQGANSQVYSLGATDEGRRLVVNSTGRKWEFTFTTLVTFGGAFFASFPLFYSTSFGGAYWLWMIILFTFVLQAVSYEFQNKLGNFLGPRLFQFFLVLNGIVGPLLLGGAVATFFEGSNFIVQFDNLTNLQIDNLQFDNLAAAVQLSNSEIVQLSNSEIVQLSNVVVSRWGNASHGLDALLNPWVLVFGFAVVFLARLLGTLYVINNVDDNGIRSRGRHSLMVNAVPFVVLFVAYLVHLLFKDGYAYNAEGYILMEPNKYLHNLIDMWYVAIILIIGVVLVLYGIATELLRDKQTSDAAPLSPAFSGIWPAGAGTVLTVLALLLTVGWNMTAYYPSTAHLQSSLTIANSSSSEFTLRTMFYVSFLVPFVLAYIVYCWRAIDKKKITREEINSDHAY